MTENELTVRAALPGSHLDITERTGINERTVRGILGRMHKRDEVHITVHRSKPNSGPPSAIFARGMGPARAKAKSVAPQKATWITPLLAPAKKASTFTYLP